MTAYTIELQGVGCALLHNGSAQCDWWQPNTIELQGVGCALHQKSSAQCDWWLPTLLSCKGWAVLSITLVQLSVIDGSLHYWAARGGLCSPSQEFSSVWLMTAYTIEMQGVGCALHQKSSAQCDWWQPTLLSLQGVGCALHHNGRAQCDWWQPTLLSCKGWAVLSFTMVQLSVIDDSLHYWAARGGLCSPSGRVQLSVIDDCLHYWAARDGLCSPSHLVQLSVIDGSLHYWAARGGLCSPSQEFSSVWLMTAYTIELQGVGCALHQKSSAECDWWQPTLLSCKGWAVLSITMVQLSVIDDSLHYWAARGGLCSPSQWFSSVWLMTAYTIELQGVGCALHHNGSAQCDWWQPTLLSCKGWAVLSIAMVPEAQCDWWLDYWAARGGLCSPSQWFSSVWLMTAYTIELQGVGCALHRNGSAECDWWQPTLLSCKGMGCALHRNGSWSSVWLTTACAIKLQGAGQALHGKGLTQWLKLSQHL